MEPASPPPPLASARTVNNNDYFCEKLYEVCVLNMQLPAHPTAFLSIHVYHRAVKALETAEESDDVKYIMAMASLAIVAKTTRLKIDIDDILIAFYPVLMHEEINYCEPPDDFFKLKDCVKDMFGLIFRKLCKSPILCKLPSEYLFDLGICLQECLPTHIWEDYNIMDISFSLVTDFYLRKDFLQFESPHIAVAALYATLKRYYIMIRESEIDLLNWAKGVVKDIIFKDIEPIVNTMCLADIQMRRAIPFHAAIRGDFSQSPVRRVA